MKGLFVSGVGTGVGKTFLSRGLARYFFSAGERVVALKPIETGCAPDALDAKSLAQACGQPDVDFMPGFFRARLPLSPYAVELQGEQDAPSVESLSQCLQASCSSNDLCLIEGAGGLMVPLNARETILDLVAAIRLPIILVADDRLGVLSYTFTALQCAHAKDLHVCAVVMSEPACVDGSDVSPLDNAEIVRTHEANPYGPSLPIFRFPTVPEPIVQSGSHQLDSYLADLAQPIAHHLMVRIFR